MKVAAILAVITAIALGHEGAAMAQGSADVQRRMVEMKAKHERSVAEMRRQHEQQFKQIRSHALQGSAGNNARSLASRSSTPAAPAFNPAAAPSPVECLAKYVLAARRARSMEDVLKHLPLAEQRSLKEHQATYDPSQAAKSREWFRKQTPCSTRLRSRIFPTLPTQARWLAISGSPKRSSTC